MWHASIARLGRIAPIPTDRWSHATVGDAKRRLLAALEDVGQPPTVLTMRRISIHIRRSLASDEMNELSCEWLAIPAQDEFSEDGEMEMAL